MVAGMREVSAKFRNVMVEVGTLPLHSSRYRSWLAWLGPKCPPSGSSCLVPGAMRRNQREQCKPGYGIATAGLLGIY